MYSPPKTKIRHTAALACAAMVLTGCLFLCIVVIDLATARRGIEIASSERVSKPRSEIPGAIVASSFEPHQGEMAIPRLQEPPPGTEEIDEQNDEVIPTIPALILPRVARLAKKEIEYFIYDSSILDSPPIPVVRLQPRYPHKLKTESVEGRVTALISVNEEGQVYAIEIEQSDNSLFSHSVVEALLNWRFVPGRINGKKVRFKMRQPIAFRLVDRSPDNPPYLISRIP